MRILQSGSLSAIALVLSGGSAFAQVADPAAPSTPPVPAAVSASDEEIIVTARKRDETLISVPVVVTAISGKALVTQGVTNLDGLARVTPQLLVGPQGGSVQGGNINIRGIEGPDQNPFGDSAVSFNIDGVQVTKATVRRMSDFDIVQVEVLKGPQALFFGKNSPAGIISIRTADPTPTLEAKLSAGYEFHADQVRVEGYVSTPLTDTLGLRIAGVYSDMRGDLKDLTPRNSPYYNGGRNPTAEDWAVRGTLKFEDGGPFNARLKVNYGEVKGDGPASNTAFISCPAGRRFTTFLGGTIDQCSANDGKNSNAGYGTVLAGIGGDISLFRPDGRNFNNQNQLLTGLEMNYEIGNLTLTSVTGYYKVKVDQCQNYENDDTVLLPSCNVLDIKELSQELRFNSSFEGPLNFSGGVYFADTRAATGSITYLFGGNFDLLAPGFGGPNSPALINNYYFKQRGKAYSAYMQVSFKPVDTIEIDVGGRYTRETKRLPLVLSGGGLSDGIIPGTPFFDQSTVILTADELAAAGNPASYQLGTLTKRKDAWTDFSPEITASYRPNQNITAFASYKHGFLSGGFNSGSVTFNPPSGDLDLSYNPQTVKGFEAGLKTSLLDGALRMNLAAYSYKISDQQVTVVFNTTNSIRNAGASKVKGVEFDFNYRTPLDGLSVRGAAAYNKGKYTDYDNAPCYGGQTVALGCRANGTQDLSGTELIRAPKWNLSAGFDYEAGMTESLKLGINGGVNHVSSYLTDASSAPNGRQGSYTLLNGTVRLFDASDRWEAALIGRNLTNKYYFVASSLVPFAFDPTGANTTLDRFASISRGREIMLRVSYKFGG